MRLQLLPTRPSHTLLPAPARTTNPFVVLTIKGERHGSRCEFETVNPDWNYQINFESVVSVSSVLTVRG